jgi:hypothetical protein
MSIKSTQLFQLNYQTRDHICTPALTQIFSALDAANLAGYSINHSNQTNILMLDPDHFYDVADALGYPITIPPTEMIKHLKKLVWPRWVGIEKFKTSLWPTAKSVTCWTFDLNKSESKMDNQNLNEDQLLSRVQTMHAVIGVVRQSLNAAPLDRQVSLNAHELSIVFTQQYDLLDDLLQHYQQRPPKP